MMCEQAARRVAMGLLSALVAVTGAFGLSAAEAEGVERISSDKGAMLEATALAEFDEPWAMSFLPDGRMLVTTKPGELFLVTESGDRTEVSGLWKVAYGGQGGLGDVVPHPDFATNRWVYISNAEEGRGGRGAVLRRAKLVESGGKARLEDAEVIWTQVPKVRSGRHYGHRIAFGPDGMLYVTSSDRGERPLAQRFDNHLGKVLRLHEDGRVPEDNPWRGKGDIAKSFWSMGHRNILGIAFDAEGRLWTNEMGPRHGDEINLTLRGSNQGWPEVSMGDHYSGAAIPDHSARDGFNPPEAFWVPSIAPSSLIIYQGAVFGGWGGDAVITGLVSGALIRVDIEGDKAREIDRFDFGARLREVEEGPDGALFVLEDGDGGRLLKLAPAN